MTKELGQRIRVERTARKMTQEELAERADLHPTYIGQVERGEKSLTIASLEKIVEGLGISFSDLFENLQPPTKPASYAMQCYDKISAYPKETQKQFYELICAAEKLMK
ncbi:helix-turn-helix domain-containing protein [Gemmiger sp.]